MMKKFFSLAAIAAVVASMSLTSCSTSPEDYAEKAFELDKEYKQALKDNDQAKADELKKEADELGKEIEAKCKEDKEFEKEFQAACLKLYADEITK